MPWKVSDIKTSLSLGCYLCWIYLATGNVANLKIIQKWHYILILNYSQQFFCSCYLSISRKKASESESINRFANWNVYIIITSFLYSIFRIKPKTWANTKRPTWVSLQPLLLWIIFSEWVLRPAFNCCETLICCFHIYIYSYGYSMHLLMANHTFASLLWSLRNTLNQAGCCAVYGGNSYGTVPHWQRQTTAQKQLQQPEEMHIVDKNKTTPTASRDVQNYNITKRITIQTLQELIPQAVVYRHQHEIQQHKYN